VVIWSRFQDLDENYPGCAKRDWGLLSMPQG
jgi:hypothetical protein